MEIKQIELGVYATNCYLLINEVSAEAVVVDPADDATAIAGLLEKSGAHPVAILLTHRHFDHILAVPGLQQLWPELPVYCHPLDVPQETEEYDMGRTLPTVAAFQNRQPLADGEVLPLAGMSIQVLHTPGHTPGSVTYQVEDALFTGDTLFRGSMGRTDFPGGDMEQMAASLARLAGLAGEYRVFPGHNSATTLERERRENPFIQALGAL